MQRRQVRDDEITSCSSNKRYYLYENSNRSLSFVLNTLLSLLQLSHGFISIQRKCVTIRRTPGLRNARARTRRRCHNLRTRMPEPAGKDETPNVQSTVTSATKRICRGRGRWPPWLAESGCYPVKFSKNSAVETTPAPATSTLRASKTNELKSRE